MGLRTHIIRDERIRQNLLSLIETLDLSKPWSVTVEPYKRDRSLEQNALYWRWCAHIASDTGNDKEDVHESLMRMHLMPRMGRDMATGEIVERYSTRKLKVKEFSEYLDKIHAWAAATLGIALPVPEEMHMKDRN